MTTRLFEYLGKITDKSKDDMVFVEIRAGLYEALCYGVFANGGIDLVKEFVKKHQSQNFKNAAEKYKEMNI